MDVKIDVKTKYKVNGKEYSSLEEMPPEIRAMFKEPLTGLSVPMTGPGMPSGGDKIVVNGVEYSSLESMPPEARQMYEEAMTALQADEKSMEKEMGFSGMNVFPDGQPGPPGISGSSAEQESSGFSKALIIAAMLAGLFLLIYFMYKR